MALQFVPTAISVQNYMWKSAFEPRHLDIALSRHRLRRCWTVSSVIYKQLTCYLLDQWEALAWLNGRKLTANDACASRVNKAGRSPDKLSMDHDRFVSTQRLCVYCILPLPCSTFTLIYLYVALPQLCSTSNCFYLYRALSIPYSNSTLLYLYRVLNLALTQPYSTSTVLYLYRAKSLPCSSFTLLYLTNFINLFFMSKTMVWLLLTWD